MAADAGIRATSDSLRILIIDHHDSYTLNLLISIAEATDCKPSIVVLAHDHALLATTDSFKQHLLSYFDAIILGPGPGHPSNEEDFGPARRILSAALEQEIRIPILGICLGHQGIALACGGKVIQADSLRHGLVSALSLDHPEQGALAFPDLFDGFEPGLLSQGDLQVIRYNSLTVEEDSLPSELVVTAWSHDTSCPSPPPVRNNFFPSAKMEATPSTPTITTSARQRVIMGLQHKTLPLWGLQFHPESIASQGGEVLMRQFLRVCRQFWAKQLSTRLSGVLPSWVRKLGTPLVASSPLKPYAPLQDTRKRFKVVTRSIDSSTKYQSACSIYERLFKAENGAATSVWLDSARKGDPQSRYSYMSRPSWHLSYDRECNMVELYGSNKETHTPIASFDVKSSMTCSSDVKLIHGLLTPGASRPNSPDRDDFEVQNGFWTWLSAVQATLQSELMNEEGGGSCPFKTGFVGYMDYEMKEESLRRGQRSLKKSRPSRSEHDTTANNNPSAWFGFCDRILAFDHAKEEWLSVALVRVDDERLDGKVLEQIERSLEKDGSQIGLSMKNAEIWMSEVETTLRGLASESKQESLRETEWPVLPPLSPTDSSSVYKEKVEAARAYIAQGDSYEICLTNQFMGQLSEEDANPGKDHNYRLYEKLRIKNPAPYSAFLNLGHGRSILSTSPERFMNIDEDGRVEMRPIKGTLARAGYRNGEEAYRVGKEIGDRESTRWCEMEDERRRKALECDPKERAENLMIVDLIRADLLSFCSPESVKVPRLIKVESYESVHQLVTTIKGRKDSTISPVQALQRCFPPGSMTGAPKVRSVEILEKLEKRPRGVYSGILGWIGLDGAASTSVVIRTVVINGRQISIGAGGAVTYLSYADKEWQEVLDKLLSIATIQ
jgi:para-aminobenzoate synthetase